MSDSNSDFRLLKILHHNAICFEPSCIENAKTSARGSECWKYFSDLPVDKYLELITGHYYKSCLNPWWIEIKAGRKRFEGRIRSKIWKYIKKGDLITFLNEKNERFTVKVVEIHHYLNFNAAYAQQGNLLIPDSIKNFYDQDADQIYHDLLINSTYKGDEEAYQKTLNQNGVIAIEMELLNN